jgi:hypothetical protein
MATFPTPPATIPISASTPIETPSEDLNSPVSTLLANEYDGAVIFPSGANMGNPEIKSAVLTANWVQFNTS